MRGTQTVFGIIGLLLGPEGLAVAHKLLLAWVDEGTTEGETPGRQERLREK